MTAELLEAAGRLVSAAEAVPALEPHDAARLLALVDGEPERVLGTDELETAAVAVARALDRLDDAPDFGDPRNEICRALAARSVVERRIVGCEALCGRGPRLSVALTAVLGSFDEIVRADLWRLTALNDVRAEALREVAPPHRARFWWWHEAGDVPPEAAGALAAVATLCARFPEARERFDVLVDAQHAWDSARPVSVAPVGATGRVVSLGAWLARLAVPRNGEPITLAAAGLDDEVTLIERADVEVSWSPPGALYVDVVAQRAHGARPTVVLGDGRVLASEPVEGAVERFLVRIGPDALASESIEVRVPLSSGLVVLHVPPSEP